MPTRCSSQRSTLATVLIIIGSFLFYYAAFSQANISGKVLDHNQAPIANASVLLLHQKDSSLHKGTTSNSTGLFAFNKIPAGNYLLLYSHAGMANQYSKGFTLSAASMNLDEVYLQPAGKELSGVTVTAKRPMFEQKIDRMVVNVQSSITNAGSTVLEVLERSPGVVVDRQSGEIGLMGKQGVQLMINGRLTYMPTDAVVQMLGGMSASGVEKIELITTPPAKYDAGGGAGMINIVLVSNPEEGLNGSYAFSAGYGHGEIYNASANFNYRRKRVNLYGNYSFSYDGQTDLLKFWRSVMYQGNQYENGIVADRDKFQRNHDPRIGLDYQLSKKTVIGAIIAGFDHRWEALSINQASNFINKIPDTSIVIDNKEVNHWQNLLGNLNIQHQFNARSQLSWNADYLWYKNQNPTDYDLDYSKDGQFIFNEEAESRKTTFLNIFVTNIDITSKLNNHITWEYGAKTTFSNLNNDVLVQTRQNGNWNTNPEFTGKYKLHDDIYAAYLSGEFKLSKKTMIKTGLRYEYSKTNLGSETQKNIVDRKYGSLFPTVYINHQLNEKNSINLQYNRRISRPGFNHLAPFLIFVDPKTTFGGNAALQPAISDAVSFNYTYGKWIFSASYNYTSRPISFFLATIDSSSNRQISVYQNMNYSHSVLVTLAMPMQLTKWWSSLLNANAQWMHINFDNNKVVTDTKIVRYRLSLTETFLLPMNFSFELSGRYDSKSLLGALVRRPYGRLDVTIQKKLPRISANISLSGQNILNTWIIQTSQEIPAQSIYSYNYLQNEFPYVRLAWTQNFGRNTVKASRKRSMASDEEQKRVQ